MWLACRGHGPGLLKICQLTFEKPPLGLLLRERERALVGGARVADASKPATQICPCGMRQPVVDEIAAFENGVDERKAGSWSIPHGNGDRSVQLNDR